LLSRDVRRRPTPPNPLRSGRALVAVQVGQFALAGVIALTIVGLATSVASRRVGEREAISNARTTTLIKGEGLIEPLITDELVRGDPAAMVRMAYIVDHQVLEEPLVRVKIWTASGRLVFSDESRLIGETFPLDPPDLVALRSGRISAAVSNLRQPENRYERQYHKLLEVYFPVKTPSGEPLLFEAYYRYDTVQQGGSRLWRSFAPISLGALVMLEFVQIPLAWSLARRLRFRLREREGLLQRALDASEVERRQIASDLHDGVVQDLAGVAYSLSAVVRQDGPIVERQDLVQPADTLRESIRALRSLVIDLYPPDLREEGLDSALRDLVERARHRGVPTALDTSAVRDPIPDAVAGLLYRSAQEGLRNALSHAEATSVRMRVATEGRLAVLEVVDDGSGFDQATAASRAASGHVGLKALAGLLTDAGGSLDIRSRPGAGTALRAVVPLP
jgi:two-component system, NarL family, sensor kinase